MKTISLTNNKTALVDDDNFDCLNQFKWHVSQINKNNKTHYARRTIYVNKKTRSVLMHREILGLDHGDRRQVDHINGDGLDNRKENLRICDTSKNVINRSIGKINTSGYKGVNWRKKSKKWVARIGFNNKRIYLGDFNNKEDAARAYDTAALKYYGEFAKLNFPK